MFKKVSSFVIIIAISLALAGAAQAADEQTTKYAPGYAATLGKSTTPTQGQQATKMPMPSLGIISGTITKISNANTANATIEVKSDKDNSMHTLAVMPSTNVTKITDISELKTGEPVRVISRKVNDKDTAVGIIFGNIKSASSKIPTPPSPVTPKPLTAITQKDIKK